MIRTHTKAVLDLLTGTANLTAYDTQAPDKAAPPFVVFRPDSGLRDRSSVLATSDRFTMTGTLTCVGVDRVQAQWVAEKAVGALLDIRPTIASRTSSPIEHLYSQQIQRDDDFTPPLFYAVELVRFFTVPA